MPRLSGAEIVGFGADRKHVASAAAQQSRQAQDGCVVGAHIRTNDFFLVDHLPARIGNRYSDLSNLFRSVPGPRRERPKITAVVDVEIRLSARWRALPPLHCSASHYAERRRDADPDSCRLSRLVSWQVPS